MQFQKSNKSFQFCLLLVTLTLCFNLYAVGNSTSKHPTNLIVKLKEGQKFTTLKYIKSIKHLYGNVFLLKADSLINLKKLQMNLDHSKFAFIQRDRKTQKRELPKAIDQGPILNKSSFKSIFNDPKASRQWLIKDSTKGGISQEIAYSNRRRTSQKKIIVAVVDTGVDVSHEDLKDVIWTNPLEIPGNGIDDDHNGYIDDIHGINTLKRDQNGNATGDITPVHPHGTHVSGIIGAKQNNHLGIAGIASNVSIMGIETVPARGDELDSNVIESFIYAAKNGAKIINCSFGKKKIGTEQAVSDAIDYIAKNYGVLVVAAAGNDSNNIDDSINSTYPANLQNESLLVVASTTIRGGLSYFSNYGVKNVDLAAPGSNIYSTIPGNRYASMSGTSMATPVVVGVAAEILSTEPNLTPIELKNHLMNTVTPKNSWRTKMVSAGTINLNKALNQ